MTIIAPDFIPENAVYRAGGPETDRATSLPVTTLDVNVAPPARPVLQVHAGHAHCHGTEANWRSASNGSMPFEAVNNLGASGISTAKLTLKTGLENRVKIWVKNEPEGEAQDNPAGRGGFFLF